MNFKYYLRGLGFGIIASALILGFHFTRTSKQMSDDEIKKRAAQLGMVEANETLVSADDEMTAEELLETIDDSKGDDDKAIVETPENDTDVSETADESATEDEEQDTSQDISDADATDNQSSDNLDLDSKITELENTTEEIKSDLETVTDAVDDPDRTTIGSDTSVTETVSGEITLVISSGDSSYAVAKKLVELGLVDDASDYDLYLCNNGYDRYIRTGTYTFSTDATNQDIAKAITGK